MNINNLMSFEENKKDIKEMNLLKGHTTYLIGPIDEVEDCGKDWREELKPFLWNMGMGVFDPCDKPIGKSEDSVTVEKVRSLKRSKRYGEARKVMKEIVNVDLTLLDLSSILIAYIDKDVHMCGSYSELTYGALEKKSIYVVCKQGKDEVPNWLYGLLNPDLFYDSFTELKQALTSLNQGIVRDPKFPKINFDKVYGHDR